MSFTRPLPRYRCHKVVQALKIAHIFVVDRGYELHFADAGFCPHLVDHAWVKNHGPCGGGYLVVYPDGYQSFSPAEAFEAGYSLIGDGPAVPDTRDRVLGDIAAMARPPGFEDAD